MPIRKTAVIAIEQPLLTAMPMQSLKTIKETLQLHPISTDVLNRRSPNGTRNQCQILKSI